MHPPDEQRPRTPPPVARAGTHLLYEADLKGEPPTDVLAALPVAPDPYVTTLVTAVGARHEQIDELVASAAIGWDLDRMAVVDRNVLRLATAELLACDDVPTAVILTRRSTWPPPSPPTTRDAS